MNQKLLLILAVILIVPLVTSQLIYEQNSEVDLKIPCINNGTICSGSAVCNLTATYPNGSLFINNKRMTNQGSYHNYTLLSSRTLGTYHSTMFCEDGGINGYSTFEFKITENGNDDPEGIVVIVYSIIFFILLVWLIFSMFLIIGRMVELNTDFLDVAYTMSGYFGLLGYYYFAQIYFAKQLVLSVSLIFIKVGAFTHVFLPLTAFVLALTLGELRRVKV